MLSTQMTKDEILQGTVKKCTPRHRLIIEGRCKAICQIWARMCVNVSLLYWFLMAQACPVGESSMSHVISVMYFFRCKSGRCMLCSTQQWDTSSLQTVSLKLKMFGDWGAIKFTCSHVRAVLVSRLLNESLVSPTYCFLHTFQEIRYKIFAVLQFMVSLRDVLASIFRRIYL
jgi:hypothetical protein